MADPPEENPSTTVDDLVDLNDRGSDGETDRPTEDAYDSPPTTSWARGLKPWARALIAFLIYLVAAIAIWAGPILTDLRTRSVGNGKSDAKFYEWAIGWMHWSVLHGVDPLYSSKVFAPTGTSLTWTSFTPAGGFVMLPVRSLFGSVAATNVLMLLAPALAGWAAYLVCHRLTQAFWPSLVGGYLFAYSSYMTGQMHGHLNLVLIFPVPLVVYLVIRRVEGSMGRVAFIALMTMALVVLFLCSTELFATAAFFGALAYIIAIIAAGNDRGRVVESGVLTVVAYVLSAVVLSPYLIAAVRNEPTITIRDTTTASVDLASFLVPRSFMGGLHLVSPAFDEKWSARILPLPIEDAGYLSVALVVVLVGFAITDRRRRETWALLGFVALVSVAALGPVLHLLGRPSTTMPWTVMTNVPLLRNATPQRFPAYSALAIAVICALWLARAPKGQALFRWGSVLLGAVLLFPNWAQPNHLPQDVPAFFTSGDYRNVLHPDEVVFVIPKSKGEELLWQDAADFSFRLAQGYLGPVPEAFQGEPLSIGMTFSPRRTVPAEELARWLDEHEVTSVVLADVGKETFGPLLRSAGGQPISEDGGVSVWRPENGSWSAKISG